MPDGRVDAAFAGSLSTASSTTDTLARLAAAAAVASAAGAGVDACRRVLDVSLPLRPRVVAVADTALHGALAAAVWASSALAAPGGARALAASARAAASAAAAGGGRALLAVLSAHARLPWSLLSLALCGACGALVDVDHFIAAGRPSLDAALSLPGDRRPWGHNSALAAAAVAAGAAAGGARGLPHAGALLAVALFSHHLRDATRRGLWLGWAAAHATPPLPYAAYLLALAALSLAAAAWVASAARAAPPASAAAAPAPLLPR